MLDQMSPAVMNTLQAMTLCTGVTLARYCYDVVDHYKWLYCKLDPIKESTIRLAMNIYERRSTGWKKTHDVVQRLMLNYQVVLRAIMYLYDGRCQCKSPECSNRKFTVNELIHGIDWNHPDVDVTRKGESKTPETPAQLARRVVVMDRLAEACEGCAPFLTGCHRELTATQLVSTGIAGQRIDEKRKSVKRTVTQAQIGQSPPASPAAASSSTPVTTSLPSSPQFAPVQAIAVATSTPTTPNKKRKGRLGGKYSI